MKQSISLLVVAVGGISMAGCYSPQGRPDYTASGAPAAASIQAQTPLVIPRSEQDRTYRCCQPPGQLLLNPWQVPPDNFLLL